MQTVPVRASNISTGWVVVDGELMFITEVNYRSDSHNTLLKFHGVIEPRYVADDTVLAAVSWPPELANRAAARQNARR